MLHFVTYLRILFGHCHVKNPYMEPFSFFGHCHVTFPYMEPISFFGRFVQNVIVSCFSSHSFRQFLSQPKGASAEGAVGVREARWQPLCYN